MVNPYSSDYNTVLDEAQRDQNAQARPELAAHIENMDEYDIVMLGYPNWWYSCPMAIYSFLDTHDLSDKQVYLFCSHGTGGLASSVRDITASLPSSTDLSDNVFHVYQDDTSSAKNDVLNWLNELKY